ncbi:acyl-CoA dehydrogenase family protein [Amycolatopsis taiwanensis]
MNGHEEFCETFFADARTDAANIVGNVGEGWQVATRLLGHERGGGTSIELPIRFRADLDRLVELAREQGKLDDPGIRHRIGWCHERIAIMRGLGLRAVTRFLADEPPGAESSIFKLFWSSRLRVGKWCRRVRRATPARCWTAPTVEAGSPLPAAELLAAGHHGYGDREGLWRGSG